MKKEIKQCDLLEAFLLGLKLGHVLDCRVDMIDGEHIGLMIPATLEGDDTTDHYGFVNRDPLQQGYLTVYFDTLNERLSYAIGGCEQEASVEASMALDSEWWEAKAAEREREEHPSH